MRSHRRPSTGSYSSSSTVMCSLPVGLLTGYTVRRAQKPPEVTGLFVRVEASSVMMVAGWFFSAVRVLLSPVAMARTLVETPVS